MIRAGRYHGSLSSRRLVVCGASGADEYSGKPQQALRQRATRSRGLWKSGAPAPRGGTTKGAPVTLDLEPSKAWKDLRADGISAQERDRRAILAMAGTYRVTFDFLEVVPFDTQDKPNAPYQSWGTEKVYVDSDDGKNISLVHILEMRIVQKDGSISEPMVTKHWRQDWQYEPTHIVEYRGPRSLAASQAQRRGIQGRVAANGVSSRRIAALCERRTLGTFRELLNVVER